VVAKINVKVGDKLSAGQLILSLTGDSTSGPAGQPAPLATAAVASVPAPAPVAAPVAAPATYQYQSASGFPPPASPSIRHLADQLGIDLGRVRGSESGGRITMADVKAYILWLQAVAFQPGNVSGGAATTTPKVAPERIDFSKWGEISRKPLSALRQTIARRMSENWNSIPHVTQFDEADITGLMALRKKYAPAYEKKGTKLTVTSFTIKAVVAALKKYPQFNVSLDESANELVLKEYFHIGIAVDTESGLIVPVLRDADKKSLLDISVELETLAEKTRARKVNADDLKGGSFTISNLGGIGGSYFTPIVNKPEVAILGVGRGVSRAMVIKDKIEARLMLPLALSYDHRVIDGADGVRFIREICAALENFEESQVKI
jgi:pyruvate dehydrogenase E2 component (dihydrolipoamide acetyltransferase)